MATKTKEDPCRVFPTTWKQHGEVQRGWLKRHGPFVAFYFYCKIMLHVHGINYTYCSVKTVKMCFHVPFRG